MFTNFGPTLSSESNWVKIVDKKDQKKEVDQGPAFSGSYH